MDSRLVSSRLVSSRLVSSRLASSLTLSIAVLGFPAFASAGYVLKFSNQPSPHHGSVSDEHFYTNNHGVPELKWCPGFIVTLATVVDGSGNTEISWNSPFNVFGTTLLDVAHGGVTAALEPGDEVRKRVELIHNVGNEGWDAESTGGGGPGIGSGGPGSGGGSGGGEPTAQFVRTAATQTIQSAGYYIIEAD